MGNKKRTLNDSEFQRAIDGARTRGLDLGKVARYQLRHYRICLITEMSPSMTRHILAQILQPVKCFFSNFFKILYNM